MNELQNMILIDVKEALFDICFKYEKMLGIEFDNGVDPEIESIAAEAIFDITCKARFKAMDEILRSDSSYSDIVSNLPGIDGLTVAEFVRLCYRSNLNYRIVKESSGGKTEIIFEMIDDLKSGSWDDEEMRSAILQKIECEEDGDEGFFILTYYKR